MPYPKHELAPFQAVVRIVDDQVLYADVSERRACHWWGPGTVLGRDKNRNLAILDALREAKRLREGRIYR